MITETTYRLVWKAPRMRKYRTAAEYTVTTYPDGRYYADVTWYSLRTGKTEQAYMLSDPSSIAPHIARWLAHNDGSAVHYLHYVIA